MRRPALLLAVLTLACTPAWASMEIQPGATVFSSGYCDQVICPAEVDPSTNPNYMKDLVAKANFCVARSFSLVNKGGAFIEQSFGLDANNCLSTRDIPREKVGATMTPKCCVAPNTLGKQDCQIVCRLYGVK